MISLKNDYKTTTIKQFLKYKGLSYRTITQLAKEFGILTIDNCPQILTNTINKGKTLQINYEDKKATTNYPYSNAPLNIVYEDKDILIVDKPNKLPTIPSHNYKDSLASRVIHYLGEITFRALNRLDADTTGIVIIAKNVITENILSHSGNIKKYYITVVEGKTKLSGTVNAPIKDSQVLKRRIVSNDGLPAITYYRRLKYNKIEDTSIIKCHLQFGRTNQIRCHLSHILHPLKFDTKYGSLFLDTSQTFYLRCYKVTFKHPYSNKLIKIILPLNLPKS